jgi:hypothetical protein
MLIETMKFLKKKNKRCKVTAIYGSKAFDKILEINYG